MTRVEIVRCSVIKHKRRDYVLGKEVYILIIAKNNIKQYKPIRNLKQLREACYLSLFTDCEIMLRCVRDA
ncbi:MAG: hypothetical protein QXP37_01845, partial [Zestosphaera sp.]